MTWNAALRHLDYNPNYMIRRNTNSVKGGYLMHFTHGPSAYLATHFSCELSQ